MEIRLPVFESSSADDTGLWATAAGPVSFGLGSEDSLPAEEFYRVRLPGDLQSAHLELQNKQASLVQLNASLDRVPLRLDDLVERSQDRSRPNSGLSFDVKPIEQEMGLEGELLGNISRVDSSAGKGLSFGIEEAAGEVWQAAEAQISGLMQQLDRDVLHFAWVETSISNQLVARSLLNWKGDLQTIWMEDLSPDQASLHSAALLSAVRTRHLRLRLLATVASGSIKIASLMVTPGGALLALPAVYQYVIKILAQARELQTI